MMKNKKNEVPESMTMNIMDMEFGQLPNVAHHLAAYDTSKINEEELKQLCIKSRIYLRLLLDKAIARCESMEG